MYQCCHWNTSISPAVRWPLLLESSTTHMITLNLHDSIMRQYHEDPHSLDEETEVQRGKESQVTCLEGGRAECQSLTPPKPCSSLYSVSLCGGAGFIVTFISFPGLYCTAPTGRIHCLLEQSRILIDSVGGGGGTGQVWPRLRGHWGL